MVPRMDEKYFAEDNIKDKEPQQLNGAELLYTLLMKSAHVREKQVFQILSGRNRHFKIFSVKMHVLEIKINTIFKLYCMSFIS